MVENKRMQASPCRCDVSAVLGQGDRESERVDRRYNKGVRVAFRDTEIDIDGDHSALNFKCKGLFGRGWWSL